MRVRNQSEAPPTQLLLHCILRNDAISSAFFNRVIEQLSHTAFALQSAEDDHSALPIDCVNEYVTKSPVPLVQTQQHVPKKDIAYVESCIYTEYMTSVFKTSDAAQIGPATSQKLFEIGLVLIGNSSRELSIAARDMVCVLIPHIPLVDHGTMLLNRIYYLLSLVQPSHYANTAARVWFQWLSNTENAMGSCLHDALLSSEYWSHLQKILRQGYSEERKFALSVLKHSVDLLDTTVTTQSMYFEYENRAWSCKEYEKFCILFQTIVLGRYQNQVDECLIDLAALVVSGKVHNTWIQTLLMSVFHGDVQETIRRSVGNWFMDFANDSAQHISTYYEFILTSFVPWATTGTWFTTSIELMDQKVVCVHGRRLSRCIAKVVASIAESERGTLINALFKYLEAKGDSIYPFASAYVFEGISDGIKTASGTGNNGVDLELACRLTTRSANREIPRDLMTVYCILIRNFAKMKKDGTYSHSIDTTQDVIERWAELKIDEMKSSIRSTQEDLKRLLQAPDADSNLISESSRPVASTLSRIQHQIVDSKFRSLLGSGLVTTCTDLELLVGSNEVSKCSMDDLIFVIQAVWDETETQDYPKDVTMRLPCTLLDPKILQRSLGDEAGSLLRLISKAVHRMYRLSESRIYMLSPVMTAIRRAVLAVPCCVSGINIPTILIRFSKNPPSPSIESLIEVSLADQLCKHVPHRKYESYYGRREGFAYAAVFDLVSRLTSDEHSELRVTLHDALLEPWMSQKLPIPVVTKWKKTEQLQMLLILSSACLARSDSREGQQHLSDYLLMLSLEPLPRFRHLLEWIILRIFLAKPDLRTNLLSLIKEHGNPKHAASLIKIAVKVACFDDSTLDFASKLLSLLVAFSASSKVAIRIEAQWSIHILRDHSEKKKWTQITDNPAIFELDAFLRSHDRFNAPIPSRILESFDPIQDHTLNTLFSGTFLDIEPREARKITYSDFKALYEDDTKDPYLRSIHPPSMPLDAPIPNATTTIQPVLTAEPSPPSTNVTADPTHVFAQKPNVPLQTKGLALSHPSLTSTSSSRNAYPLILCASLIDNPYNLGGLSRCAEIFSASSLLLPSLSHLASPRFTSVAVTSHLHIPISQLTPVETPEYLRAMKKEGYKIVGVEQTDQSVVLGEQGVVLPRKCVLVMGSEKEGISSAVLMECDVCMEIRQEGVTRSLNVQTAASVVLFEYQRQWFGKGKAWEE
ncbi:hypothetical protein EJ05DRAFT_9978 [Pseudovirgaria hyperparasitica]|uniref:tRNA/rRNA methyltransferase SpoU type domain-containing protein n=1 Tax=Pseudovirgaria hyperparasitica TaxID=470096 RepID=A0A6A6WKL2_9PEZI|nr:uncharacterized protein EJ05DRAFT_9978 [Pseudovirgaria hyperparasitica]KAF2762702.1 hypothetical protein EJ05DRAFT_9978 [Pseudovirgaria hyperparasitica]